MKAVFLKKDKRCVGVVQHAPEGHEAGLVGQKNKNVIVREVPEQIALTIQDRNNSLTFSNLKLKGKNIVLDETIQAINVQPLRKKDQDLLFILDESNPIEERFNKLVSLVMPKYIRTPYR